MLNINLKEITILLLLILLISSCGFKSSQTITNSDLNISEKDSLGYEVAEKVFEDISESGLINVIVKYPQIINLSDKNIMIKVNKQIEESAKHNYIYEEAKEENGLNLDIEYDVTYATKNIISIKFSGQLYRDPSRFMYVYPILYTINIDLKTGDMFKLSDLYKETFCNLVNNEIFYYVGFNGFYEEDINDTNSNAYRFAHADEEVKSSIFNLFCGSKDWKTLYQQNFYLKEDTLGIIIFFSGGSGTFFEFETSYDNLKEHINKDNSLWLEIYQLRK